MDFHGNNVHHLGHGHPRLIAALKAQLDELPFAPRRFTNRPAVDLARKLVDLAPPGPRQGAARAERLGRDRDGAQARPRGHRAAQDDLVLGQLPRRRLRRGERRRRGAVPLRPGRPAARRQRARGAVRLLPLPLRLSRTSAARRSSSSARMRCAQLRALRAGEGAGRRRGDRRAGARRALPAAAGLLAGGAARLRRPRRAVDLRRDPERPRQDRQAVRLRAFRRGAGHAGARQGARRRRAAGRRAARAARARHPRRARARPLHPREEPAARPRRADHARDHRGRGPGRQRRPGRRLCARAACRRSRASTR